MSMCNVFRIVYFSVVLVSVQALRRAQAAKEFALIPPCAALLDFSKTLKYNKLPEHDQLSFLTGQGCIERNTKPHNLAYTCDSPSALACASPVTEVDNIRFMCCDYTYSSRTGPEIATMLGDHVHLWQTGMSTLVQIPKQVESGVPKMLVQVNVQPVIPYWETLGCEEGRISEVVFSGSSVGESNVTIRSGAIDSSDAFAIRVGNTAWQEVSWRTQTLDSVKSIVSTPAMTISAVISAKDPEHWGPDASATVTLGSISFEVQQQTAGSGDESKVVLDVAVHGTYSTSLGVGGWLSGQGSDLAMGTQPAPCMTISPPRVG